MRPSNASARVTPKYTFAGTKFTVAEAPKTFLKPLDARRMPDVTDVGTKQKQQEATPRGRTGKYRRMSVLDRIYSRRSSIVLFPVVSPTDKRSLVLSAVLFYVTTLLHLTLIWRFSIVEAENEAENINKPPYKTAYITGYSKTLGAWFLFRILALAIARYIETGPQWKNVFRVLTLTDVKHELSLSFKQANTTLNFQRAKYFETFLFVLPACSYLSCALMHEGHKFATDDANLILLCLFFFVLSASWTLYLHFRGLEPENSATSASKGLPKTPKAKRAAFFFVVLDIVQHMWMGGLLGSAYQLKAFVLVGTKWFTRSLLLTFFEESTMRKRCKVDGETYVPMWSMSFWISSMFAVPSTMVDVQFDIDSDIQIMRSMMLLSLVDSFIFTSVGCYKPSHQLPEIFHCSCKSTPEERFTLNWCYSYQNEPFGGPKAYMLDTPAQNPYPPYAIICVVWIFKFIMWRRATTHFQPNV